MQDTERNAMATTAVLERKECTGRSRIFWTKRKKMNYN